METQIEGKEVDPHLLTIIEKPHLVPTIIMPWLKGTGTPNIKGYVDGYTTLFEAQFVVQRIRELIANILQKKIGKKLPSQDEYLLIRKIKALGREAILMAGLKPGRQILNGECRFQFVEGDDRSHFERLAIAEEGYVFSEEKRREHHNSEGYIVLDTEGQWLHGRKGRRMDVKKQEPDGEIILTSKKEEGRGYPNDFLKVADVTGRENFFPPQDLQTILAIVLKTHNLLYAIHKTCIGEEDLPGGWHSKWELPRATAASS